VSHRVGEITEWTDVSEWKWVPIKENPADDDTREFCEVSSYSRWLLGPSFLMQEESKWPAEREKVVHSDEDLEYKSEVVLVVATDDHCLPDPKRFSSWLKLIRATAWMLRFIAKTKKADLPQFFPKELTVQELHEAEICWWRNV